MEHAAIERMLRLIGILINNRSYTVADIAGKIGIDRRTVYRYLKTFRENGIKVKKRYGSVYTIEPCTIAWADDVFKGMAAPANGPEDGIILQRPCQDLTIHTGTYEAMKELEMNDILNDAPYLQKIVANVSLLVKAASTRKKVLVEYESNWRNRRCSVVIEPYSFYFYFNYVWCFEGEKRKNTAMRISRMTDVKILDEDWPSVPKHRKQVIDAFGCWGHKMKPIKLRLTMQARNLMTEAHPMSMITMREDTDYPNGEKWILETGVCDYSGITRYILGMLDEVEILEGDGLKEYIRAWREKINAVVL